MDLFRVYGRIVGNMYQIAEQQLQRVIARRKLDTDLCLATAKMSVIDIRRYWFAQIGQTVQVDQKMVMAGLLLVGSRRGDTHSSKPESHRHRTAYYGTIFW